MRVNRSESGGLSTLHISPFQEKSSVADYFRAHNAGLTAAQNMYRDLAGTSVDLDPTGQVAYKALAAEVTLHVGASLVTARPVRGPAGSGDVGGERGVVVGFSSASRRRLMRSIAAVPRAERPLFATLTYPDVFNPDVAQWKRDVDVFGKRMRREFEDVSFFWRIEFVKRKSGNSEGAIAPHFHLLIYNVRYAGARKFIPAAWYEVVGSRSLDHLSAGVRVEKIHSFGGIMRYVGKYISKQETYPAEWEGRAWGLVGRSNLPRAVVITMALTEDEGKRLVRLGRKMIRAKGKTLVYGLTWIVDCEPILDYLGVLSRFRDWAHHERPF